MDAVLASLIAVAGTLLGTVLGPLLLRHTTRKDQLRTTAARFASQLSIHRGHLYGRSPGGRTRTPARLRPPTTQATPPATTSHSACTSCAS